MMGVPWEHYRCLVRLQRTMTMLLSGVGLLACSSEAPHSDEPAAEQRALHTQRLEDASGSGSGALLSPAYPLAAAPLTWVERQRFNASDAVAAARFGQAVALSGDTALVGASGSSAVSFATGLAYVFKRAATSWTETQKLIPSGDPGYERYFGAAVALSDDTMLVGAASSGAPDGGPGAVYVFSRSAAGSWTETQILGASDSSVGDRFGTSVAVDADTAFIRSRGRDAVYVFARAAAAWAETQKLVARAEVPLASFGRSMALSGGVAFVGGYNDYGLGPDGGAVYVFGRNAAQWQETQTLKASDSDAEDGFGQAVALAGDTALIGAAGNNYVVSNLGAAYVFSRSGITWSETHQLLADNAVAGDYFGTTVALSGDTALVGASHSSGAGLSAGSVYVFVRNASTWAQTQELSASDAAPYDIFGSALAYSDGRALVGAYGTDDNGQNSGSAYLMALRSAAGESCSVSLDCASAQCVDGVCCDSACAGLCEACNLVGLEGTCSLLPKGAEPASSCGGYVCSGDGAGCPSGCTGTLDCASDHHCTSAGSCAPRVSDGESCSASSTCISGHCVDGVCCNEACDLGCGSCVVAAREGRCVALPKGDVGAPSCAPFLCSGASTDCAITCSEDGDCAAEHHCAEGACLPAGAPGESCETPDACATSYCTDGICCLADSCGAYLCGDLGACELGCSSSAQCASGHTCNSIGRCEKVAFDGGADAGGACHFETRPDSTPGWARWFGLCALIMGARRCSSRRRIPRRP